MSSGAFQVMKEAIAAVSDGTDGIHVSFDIDGIDPRHAPGVSTPVSGGLTFREAHLALEMAHETKENGLSLSLLNSILIPMSAHNQPISQ